MPHTFHLALPGFDKWRVGYLLLATCLAIGLTVALAVAVRDGLFAQSQGFDSRSDGTDGALVLTEPGTVVFDPTTFNPPLDPDGDNVFHFTDIQIDQGVTVVLSGQIFDGPVYWLATGDVQIEGTVDLSGQDGYPSDISHLTDRRPAIPGPGGYQGGIGAFGTSPPQFGFGPGRGEHAADHPNSMHGYGAGYGTSASASLNFGPPHGQTYGNEFLVPLLGGSGGSGSRITASTGSGGGAGGGAFLVASSTLINMDGTITSDGGDGGIDRTNRHHVGPGSGGAIHLVAPKVTGTGNLSAVGGLSQINPDWFGGKGRIRLDAFQQEFSGSADPTPIFGSPFVVLPTDRPSVRVVSVAGQAVPSVPTGEFQMPDAVFDQGTAVPIEIEAMNIPPGTVVQVHVISENDVDQVIDSTPLEGTVELSNATADITMPFGFSRMLLEADWTP